MAITLSGRLQDPFGNALENAGVRFRSARTSSQVLANYIAETTTDSNGDYTISVQFGSFHIEARQSTSEPWYTIARNIPITADTTSTDINSLIVAYLGAGDATPEIVIEIESITAQAVSAQQAAEAAQAASESAASSATGALESVTTNASTLPVITSMGSQILSDALDDRIFSITSSYTVTVGSGGDYSTINDAMLATKKLRKEFSDYTNYIEILLLSGFVMEEQVVVVADDYSKVMISSEDAEVVINRASLLDISGVNNVPSGYGPAFTGIRGGHLPIINVLFNMDSTGTASGRNGIFLNENSSCVVRRTKGIKNAGERGVEVANSSFYGRETVWDGAGTRCIRISNGSIANVRDSSAQNGERGLSVTSAYATAGSCNFSGNSEYGIEATRAAVVQASDSTITGCGLINIYADEGANVVANDCDISGGLYRGVDAARGSKVVLTNSNISGCADRSISASQGCEIEASFADCTDSGGSRAVAAFSGSRINLGSATAGSNIGGFAVYVNTGSIINASGVIGSCNVAADTVSSNGIVFGISSS